MKHFYKRFLLGVLFLIPQVLQAQNGSDVAQFLEAGQEDASKLITAYTEPVVRGMSYGFSGGWYHTAKAHKTLGFDLGVTFNAVFIPTSDDYFDPTSLDLTVASFSNTTNPGEGAPTIFGPKDETTYTVPDPDGAGPLLSYSFDGPEGLDFKNAIKDEIGFAIAPVMLPLAQLGIGIYKNTDLKIRYFPETDIEGTKVKVLGFGVMHDIKQHIPGIKMLPFDLSALVGFNSISGTTDLSGEFDGDNQEMEYKFDSWTVQGIISKKISVITGYAGLGYNAVKTDLKVKGTYQIPDLGSIILTDPVTIDFKNNSLFFTTGLRLKFGPLYFSGDYTFQKYNRFTFGLGFSVR